MKISVKVKIVDNIDTSFHFERSQLALLCRMALQAHQGHATFKRQLKEMFHEQTIENKERALMVKGDLAGAIDYLLTEGNKDQSKRIVDVY